MWTASEARASAGVPSGVETFTREELDHDYPFQVRVAVAGYDGERAALLNRFCQNICVHPWQRFVVVRDLPVIIYCFQRQADALHFVRQFGGAMRHA